MPDVQLTESVDEATARGINCGWDAANYHYAYVSELPPTSLAVLATAAASERYDYRHENREFQSFEGGYVLGFGRYLRDEYPDGSPQDPV